MADPIAAGAVVVMQSSLSSFELVARRPLLGVCESAVAGAPGDPPTNVIVAWEDGTRVTYALASSLASLGVPTDPSLLGVMVQYGGPALGGLAILEAGTRVRGPVVMHNEYFDAAGDPLIGPGEQNQVLTVKTKFGYTTFSRTGFVAVPNA